ncbi:TetR/AcrR family transcriptional regulator [Parvularcula marina]|uniref:TetR/AcrR family transcriptional regulator n=1 Tax=Parvularcula marina TaxID=2292771 RepID=A0A371RHK8_9PROT|nr:TetR/AcrR family transcriptional regulator [Parvularcula marina]
MQKALRKQSPKVDNALDIQERPRLSARGEATRQKLLEGAEKAFREKGYHGARVADIAGNAGVAIGNFYRHFENKNVIFLEILKPFFRGLLEVTGRQDGDESVLTQAQLAERNVRYITYYTEHQRLFIAAYEAAASPQSDHFFPTWIELRDRFFARTKGWLRSLIKNGILPESTDVEFIGEALGNMNEHYVYIRIVQLERMPDQQEIELMANSLAKLWWRALFLESDAEK